MNPLSRRHHHRFPCDLPVRVFREGSLESLGEGRLVDLGLGGASMRGEAALKHGEACDLRVSWNRRRRRLKARLIWSEAGTLGFTFQSAPGQEAFLKRLLEELRRVEEMPPSLDRTMKNYWDL